MTDEINSPAHYRLFPDMEAIDVIQRTLTPEEFKGYLKGNALKYRLRAGDKGPADKCLGKANWYQGRLRSMSVHRSHHMAPNVWEEGEKRMDNIARSHGDGEHYGLNCGGASFDESADFEPAAYISTEDGAGVWTVHDGGECPVDAHAWVEVMYRDGETEQSKAVHFAWHHQGFESDIIRYRLL